MIGRQVIPERVRGASGTGVWTLRISPSGPVSSTLLGIATTGLLLLASARAHGQPPAIESVYPPGCQAGEPVDVTVSGTGSDTLQRLHSNVPGLHCERTGDGAFRLTAPPGTPAGHYDVWGVGSTGVSAPRTFVVGDRSERLEAEPNNVLTDATAVPVDVVVNGRMDAAGDVDQFRFSALRGQQVLLECSARRIDSRLRAVLEVGDATGRRLAVNRGYFGVDPLVVFNVPEDGEYTVTVQDLIAGGGAEHYYRLEIHTGPRVLFSMPNVVQEGSSSPVTLYGWNLHGATPSKLAGGLDRLQIELSGESLPGSSLPLLLAPSQSVLADSSVAYRLSGSPEPVLIGLTDAPVMLDGQDNHSPEAAREIVIPCDVSGQLSGGDETDWFAVDALRGEVLYFEGFGERIGSPVDLELAVCDESGGELARFTDELRDFGDAYPTSHLDPAGRWVCPADGRYKLSVHNLTGGIHDDPRRVYRLSVRRADADFQVVAVPRGGGPAGLNVPRGGRTLVDLVAFRRRGMTGGIRVVAHDLPDGIECSEVWLGPGVDRALLALSAADSAGGELHELKLEATADDGSQSASKPVQCGTIVRSGEPNGWGRLTSQLPYAVAGEAPVRASATADLVLDHHLYGELTPRYSPGSVLDVAVELERRDSSHTAPVRLIGAGLPQSIRNQTAEVPAGAARGYVSFYLPPDMAVGAYSIVVLAETTVPGGDGNPQTVQVASNPVPFRVEPAGIRVEIDPFAVTRVHRGETFKVAYTVSRINGFIGKTHTELAAPGVITDIDGIRGRGETFVGQTDKGSLQIVINDNAPLGPTPFLRLLTVGVVEDEPTYLGSCFFPLEIVE